MFVPLLIAYLTGHIDVVPYLVVGAFTAIYGRSGDRRRRAVMQAGAAGSLTTAVILGSTTALIFHNPWATVAVGSLLCGVVTVVATHVDWRPAGSLFQLIAFAVSTLTAVTDILTAAGLCAASSIFAIAVGAGARTHQSPATATVNPAAMWRRGSEQLAAAAAAGSLSQWIIADGHPYWAMLSATAALSVVGPTSQVIRAVHRVNGTLIGLLLAAGLLALQPRPYLTLLLIVVLQAGAELFVLRHYGWAMVLITPLALLMTQLIDPLPVAQLLYDRAAQTITGAAFAIALILIIAGACRTDHISPTPANRQ